MRHVSPGQVGRAKGKPVQRPGGAVLFKGVLKDRRNPHFKKGEDLRYSKAVDRDPRSGIVSVPRTIKHRVCLYFVLR